MVDLQVARKTNWLLFMTRLEEIRGTYYMKYTKEEKREIANNIFAAALRILAFCLVAIFVARLGVLVLS